MKFRTDFKSSFSSVTVCHTVVVKRIYPYVIVRLALEIVRKWRSSMARLIEVYVEDGVVKGHIQEGIYYKNTFDSDEIQLV